MRDRHRPVRLQAFCLIPALRFAPYTAFLLAACAAAWAQLPSAVQQRQLANPGIVCVLRDALGHPVSGLVIEVRSALPPLELATAVSQQDGTFHFDGLPTGLYDVSVAGGILLPPRRVQVDRSSTPVVLQLPLTVPTAAGRKDLTVSVAELAVPELAQQSLRKAYEAWEANDPSRSRQLADRALQIHPAYSAALTLLGILDLRDGNPAAAAVRLRQAIQLSPNSPRAYLPLASAYNQLRQNAQALDALSIMAKLVSESWAMHYEIGRAYLGKGRYEDAITEFNRAQQLAQHDPMVLHLAKAHALLGLQNLGAARAELETGLRESPDGPYSAESRQLAIQLDLQLSQSRLNAQAKTRTSDH
jgi:tetratricopeptide (TPR) repeat protein